jgi:signal transduction histidine kinase
VPNVEEDPRFYPGIDEATGFVTRSVLAVPLEVKGKVIGVIEALNKAEGDFSQADLTLLSSMAQTATVAIENARLFANQATIALENAHLYGELKQQHERLQQAQEQMLAAERWAVLGKAAANLAHRINNTAGLIPVVTQDLEELLANVALEEERRQEIDADLQRIERNTRFTLQMADALFKPFETLPTEECDVNALLEESISVANVPKDVALTTKYADELPRVVASKRLADVFVELITNAVKSMPDGGELEIGSRLGEEGWVEVWFSDTGHGIPPENQGKIFDLFFTTSEDSLGFGLWWVQTFLSQQRATIDVESEVGGGTTFTIRLPVKGPQATVESS